MKNFAHVVVIVLSFYLAVGEGSRCSALGGTCRDYTSHVCFAGYRKGLCPGSSNIRCCLHCGSTCTSNENYNQRYRDGRCTGAGGKCMHNSNYCSSNIWRSGLCGGSSARKCCMSSGASSTGSGTCTLTTYTGSNIQGYNGRAVKVDQGFVSSMNVINSLARDCGVVVMVTSSFRKQNVPVSGAIVPPASKSNHKVGHAIDMNLKIGTVWCNSKCLAAQNNHKAKCFTDRIRAARNLRWGEDFSTKDPVHIDDGLNLRDRNAWDALYRKLQRYC